MMDDTPSNYNIANQRYESEEDDENDDENADNIPHEKKPKKVFGRLNQPGMVPGLNPKGTRDRSRKKRR